VGKFLRIAVSGLSHLVIYEDMPNVDRLLQHCRVCLNIIYYNYIASDNHLYLKWTFYFKKQGKWKFYSFEKLACHLQ
jgi:hypothetical protein